MTNTKYQWKAVYKDGGFLDQIDWNGTTHGVKEIDRANLHALMLIDNAGNVKINIKIEDGMKAIYRARKRKLIGLNSEQESELAVIHIIGVVKEGQAFLCYVDEETDIVDVKTDINDIEILDFE